MKTAANYKEESTRRRECEANQNRKKYHENYEHITSCHTQIRHLFQVFIFLPMKGMRHKINILTDKNIHT